MIKIGYYGTNQPLEILTPGNSESCPWGICFYSEYDLALATAKVLAKKDGGEPMVYIAECELEKPIDPDRGLTIFNTLPEFINFHREYFPEWFDINGDPYEYQLSPMKESFGTYRGQFQALSMASEHSGEPLIEICNKLGFDSVAGMGEFVLTSPQQILSFMEVDRQLGEDELGVESIPAEEDIEEHRDTLAAFETKSNEYIGISRRARSYRTKPGNRFTRRVKIRTNGGNNIWFDLDMNRLFKKGSFAIKVPVIGETDEYVCVISFNEWLPLLKKAIEETGFTQMTVKRSLMEMLRFHDLKVRCSCPDFSYRFSYQLTISNDIEGEPELRPSDETNPKNDLGKGCKHLLMALNNKIWADKVSRIIYNYFINLQRTQKNLFDKIIAPKLGLDKEPEEVEKDQVKEPELSPEETPEQEVPADNQDGPSGELEGEGDGEHLE